MEICDTSIIVLVFSTQGGCGVACVQLWVGIGSLPVWGGNLESCLLNLCVVLVSLQSKLKEGNVYYYYSLTIIWLLAMVMERIKIVHDKKGRQISGNFDHHVDMAVQCGVHCPIEHIPGFTR